jgi:hypothetical protein
VKQLELDDPVGHQIKVGGETLTLEIIGVVKDFHFDSMYDEIQPLVMYTFDYNSIWFLFV